MTRRRGRQDSPRGRERRRGPGQPKSPISPERAAQLLEIAKSLRGEAERDAKAELLEQASRPSLAYENIPEAISKKFRDAWNAWVRQTPGQRWTLEDYEDSFDEKIIFGCVVDSDFFHENPGEILSSIFGKILEEEAGDFSTERLESVPFAALPRINTILDFFFEEDELTLPRQLAVLQRGFEEVVGAFLFSSQFSQDVGDARMLLNRILREEIRRTFLPTYIPGGKFSPEIQSVRRAATHRAMEHFSRSEGVLERRRSPLISAVISLLEASERQEWIQKFLARSTTPVPFSRKMDPGEA